MAETAKFEEQHKELFDLMRSKKYVTYEEINQRLPRDLVSAGDIDEILMRAMAECDVEFVASDKKIPVSEKAGKKNKDDKIIYDSSSFFCALVARSDFKTPDQVRGQGAGRRKSAAYT